MGLASRSWGIPFDEQALLFEEERQMIPIKQVILEGPDCCGKSTLYRNLHKTTKYRYNVIDRSTLSKLCYAILYGRDETECRDLLMSELCEANNFFVALIPDIEVVMRRLGERGDEFQNETSLVRLHHIFSQEIAKIQNLPNVHVVRQEVEPMRLAGEVSDSIESYSRQLPGDFGKTVDRWCGLTPREEVQLRTRFYLGPTHVDHEVMLEPSEGDYYEGILSEVRSVIAKEIRGDNPYGVPQGVDSRRFYFHSDTCISSIHFLPRDGLLRVLCALRSTDSVHNGPLDLRFLAHLAAEVARDHGDWGVDRIVLEVAFNSLHVRRDKI